MDPTYTVWVFHGERQCKLNSVNADILESRRMFRDFYVQHNVDLENPLDGRDGVIQSLVDDAETPLYPGCPTFTKMSASIAMLKHKVTHDLSDSGFDELINLVRDILPENSTLPNSFYEMKKLVNTFDLSYEKIHASKVLHYFPTIPRLKRMFGIYEMATQLRWHKNNKSSDGKIKHPVNSLSWEMINRRWPHFASDSQNIRLGLATDGFNPFKDLNSKYICNDIDVYLAPLVDDLILLWSDGVEMYDAVTKSTFNLKAILMWTIHDFSAYGNVSGWPVKGKIACPICHEDTCSIWLSHGRKFAYMGHRRFLDLSHPFRVKKSWFNGRIENDIRPKIKNGEQNLNEVDKIAYDWGKSGKRKRKKNTTQSTVTWKKKSIFFMLPYWKYIVTRLMFNVQTLLVRHNLDVMHVEKNICESIISTLLDVKGKSKDGINSRKDLETMNIRHDLHPKRRGNKFYLSAAPHTLSKAEKQMFRKRLANMRLPDGYGVVDRNNVESLEEDDFETLCMLERYLPPSFFDIMVHLTIHIGKEVHLCGPVQYRWMYPFERYMKVLKGYVMNRAQPEGCIAEQYIVEENAMFCSKYIKQASEICSKPARNEEF
ncbi:uncharacterized protein LOC111392118 [Olea europaea var. sylvestris]|uniref:uncharacterized protein LOC111392118 n=1 Tax=Olea europaea var. sylvestris TaxID=158386 RepID=UPI000C1D30C3|nr:uncharacterized protein LOC111392118 [Olea europaea var. sylvestris]